MQITVLNIPGNLIMKPKSLAEYVDNLQKRGRYAFSKLNAKRETGESDSVLKLSLWRLTKKQRIIKIREGFYAIIPLEYSATGSLPPEWFISDLMEYIDQPYYVGLLSAAAIFGAAHQQPQEFHVVVPKVIRSMKAANIHIRFFQKINMKLSQVQKIKTQTGFMHISNPAVTAIDLLAYAGRVGGLDRIFTVLQELSEKLTAEMIVDAAKNEAQLSYIQRLGWLLEKGGYLNLVMQLADWIVKKNPRETPLDPSLPRKGFSRDSRWKVIVNAKVESEL